MHRFFIAGLTLEMQHKVLVVLPGETDRSESTSLDPNQYEIHVLFASEDTKDVTTHTYGPHLSQPGFLTSYVDRAVEYVKENGITAIMYSHDMASVVASVVCQRTGLPGPSLESTFCSLHKYYSRKTEKSNLWFDYINLHDPEKKWKSKVLYPCYLKAPFLMGSMGQSRIRSEEEMERALADLGKLTTPYFKGYSEFFAKYLNLEKYPLSVENIVVVEEMVEWDEQYCIEGWVDGTGRFTPYNTMEVLPNPKRGEPLIGYVLPQFTLEYGKLQKLIALTEEMGQLFGLRNTFYDIEVWKTGDNVTLVEVNSRIAGTYNYMYKKMWGLSVYKAGVYLSCGEVDKVRKETPPYFVHGEGNPISGIFFANATAHHREGKGREFLDFDYAKSGSVTDGAFNYTGPGIMLYVDDESSTKKEKSSEACLCSFSVMDCSSKQLLKRAKEIMFKLLLQPGDLEHWDI